MGLTKLLTLTTLGLVAAETSVVSLFLFDAYEAEGGADAHSLAGSVVAVDAGTTTYSINCGPGVDSNECPFLPGLWYTQGPTSIEYALQSPYDRYGTVACSLGGSTSAVCTDVLPTTGSNSMQPQTTSIGKDMIASERVTITAGATATATGASATKTDESSSTADSSTADSSSATSQGTGASSTSTGGLPQITASPGLALGGVAAALAAAAL
ncbi:hypothetical protein N7532_009264 [Penicillium argentinense]|uniref:GPI anchored protein n=1 Tax=Penicillium argentinense TaxID=1131581 RepID=A0A9W9EZ86_9EURO|nr:uncharacterized protein N7532_009264 [Penicillium argentinense]KAJ5090580.1 hypothetical protein N7532_009264 [Penicillium argentinense]